VVHDVLHGLGHDPAGVQVRHDAVAAASQGAQAFTSGDDVVLGGSAPALDGPEGMRLLAHELVHVAQFHEARRQGQVPSGRSRATDPAERQAERMADELVTHGRVSEHPLVPATAAVHAQELTPANGETPLAAVGSAAHSAAKAALESACPIQTTGTVSKTSWGETSGIYPTTSTTAPTEAEKYDPSKWDPAKVCELLKARAAVHEVGKRGQSVHNASPGSSAIEKKLKPYHFTENFPAVDAEIKDDAAVKWFYLGATSTTLHTGIKNPVLVKSYGPFFNNGGGDAAKGTIYINFFKTS
jgi:Domain of unknown function (DUF4157)